MNLIPPQWKLAFWLLTFLAAVGAASYATWWITDDHAEKKAAELALTYSEAVTASTQAQLNEVAKRRDLIHEGVAQHAKDEVIKNAAAADLAAVIISLQERSGLCASARAEEGSQNADSDQSGGVAVAGDEGRLGRFKRIIDDIGDECATMNNAVRQRNVEEGLEP